MKTEQVKAGSSRSQTAGVRQRAGVWRDDLHTLIRFSGGDAAQWLQSQTTNDVLRLESGQGHANALLDRKGKLQACFSLHRWDSEYWCLIDIQQAGHFLEQLEAHVFAEQVSIEDAGDELEQVVLQGPESALFLAPMLADGDELPAAAYACAPVRVEGFETLLFRVSYTGEDGFALVVQRGDAEPLMKRLTEAGVPLVEPETRETLRIEAGLPRMFTDMDYDTRISATPLEQEAVSYEKGCYLGQEVVAKLKSHGGVRRALMGLVFEKAAPPAGSELTIDGTKKAAQITSIAHSLTLNAPIALAYLERGFRAPGTTLRLASENGDEWNARVVSLPFCAGMPPQKLARKRYEAALERFERDSADEDAQVVASLQDAITLAPRFEDAYEALGVVLHRQGRTDEAIAVMTRLAQIDPNSVMAHTNLSVFYVAKGMIQEAEEEKARASLLERRLEQSEQEAKKMAAAERGRIRKEARERIGMFQEVLDIDPHDPLATFGLGMAHLQLDEPAKARGYFETATQVQKDYSAAFLNLGKCLEALGELDAASGAYRDGIEAASHKGDLMPMKEMQRRLTALESRLDP